MPVEFERLGLGESPWEHVRAHVFEWEHEGSACGQNRKRQRRKKRRHEKAGRHSPSRYNQPENGTPPHVCNLNRSP